MSANTSSLGIQDTRRVWGTWASKSTQFQSRETSFDFGGTRGLPDALMHYVNEINTILKQKSKAPSSRPAPAGTGAGAGAAYDGIQVSIHNSDGMFECVLTVRPREKYMLLDFSMLDQSITSMNPYMVALFTQYFIARVFESIQSFLKRPSAIRQKMIDINYELENGLRMARLVSPQINDDLKKFCDTGITTIQRENDRLKSKTDGKYTEPSVERFKKVVERFTRLTEEFCDEDGTEFTQGKLEPMHAAYSKIMTVAYNLTEDLELRLRVFVRIKPLFGAVHESVHVDSSGNISVERKNFGRFNDVFLPAKAAGDIPTGRVFNRDLLSGYKSYVGDGSSYTSSGLNQLVSQLQFGNNFILFGYGFSGSGKTHSLYGKPDDPGIVPLALASVPNIKSIQLMAVLEEYTSTVFEEGCLIELYRDRNFDLGSDLTYYMQNEEEEFRLADHDGIIPVEIQKASTRIAFDWVTRIVKCVDDHRRVAQFRVRATPNNLESSRSHMYITFKINMNSDDATYSYLTAIDLAGREDAEDFHRSFFRKFYVQSMTLDDKAEIVSNSDNQATIQQLLADINNAEEVLSNHTETIDVNETRTIAEKNKVVYTVKNPNKIDNSAASELMKDTDMEASIEHDLAAWSRAIAFNRTQNGLKKDRKIVENEVNTTRDALIKASASTDQVLRACEKGICVRYVVNITYVARINGHFAGRAVVSIRKPKITAPINKISFESIQPLFKKEGTSLNFYIDKDTLNRLLSEIDQKRVLKTMKYLFFPNEKATNQNGTYMNVPVAVIEGIPSATINKGLFQTEWNAYEAAVKEYKQFLSNDENMLKQSVESGIAKYRIRLSENRKAYLHRINTNLKSFRQSYEEFVTQEVKNSAFIQQYESIGASLATLFGEYTAGSVETHMATVRKIFDAIDGESLTTAIKRILEKEHATYSLVDKNIMRSFYKIQSDDEANKLTDSVLSVSAMLMECAYINMSLKTMEEYFTMRVARKKAVSYRNYENDSRYAPDKASILTWNMMHFFDTLPMSRIGAKVASAKFVLLCHLKNAAVDDTAFAKKAISRTNAEVLHFAGLVGSMANDRMLQRGGGARRRPRRRQVGGEDGNYTTATELFQYIGRRLGNIFTDYKFDASNGKFTATPPSGDALEADISTNFGSDELLTMYSIYVVHKVYMLHGNKKQTVKDLNQSIKSMHEVLKEGLSISNPSLDEDDMCVTGGSGVGVTGGSGVGVTGGSGVGVTGGSGVGVNGGSGVGVGVNGGSGVEIEIGVAGGGDATF